MAHLVRAEVIGARKQGPYVHLALAAPEVAREASPGQFVMVKPPWSGEHVLRRPLSIYRRDLGSGALEVVFAVVGPVTARMASFRPHDFLDVLGPLGRGFSLPPGLRSALLVGGGYGAAPILFLAETLKLKGILPWVLLGASRAERLLASVELKRVSAGIVLCTEDGSAGRRGVVTDFLEETLERSGAKEIFAAGPMPMLAALAREAARLGVRAQLSVESFMACGTGVCWSCVVPAAVPGGSWPVRACREGPVFEAGALVWEEALRPWL